MWWESWKIFIPKHEYDDFELFDQKKREKNTITVA